MPTDRWHRLDGPHKLRILCCPAVSLSNLHGDASCWHVSIHKSELMGALSRQLLVRVAFVIVVYILVEGVALAGLLLLRKTRGLTYFPAASKLYPVAEKTFDRFLAPGAKPAVIIDADLGWVRPPGPENNAAGMRDDRDHDPQPVAGILRIAAFGDSFTYGSDVKLLLLQGLA
jgi:hypothetical protein